MAEKVYVLENNPMGSNYIRLYYPSIFRACKTMYIVLTFRESALDSLQRFYI